LVEGGFLEATVNEVGKAELFVHPVFKGERKNIRASYETPVPLLSFQ
jgi:hypothetical protein